MKKFISVYMVSLICLAMLFVAFSSNGFLQIKGSATLGVGSAAQGKSPIEVHVTTSIYKEGKLLLSEYHAGNITNLGLNLTVTKLSGWAAVYNQTTYPMNTSYISIGNRGALTLASTELPGEWNRTLGTFEDPAYNSFNITCTFYPDSGPYTADCIGLNYQDGIGNGALFASDIFSEVTGIDETFTIVVEWKITVANA